MTVKLTGAQFKAFWDTPLENDSWWFEDEEITVDGNPFDLTLDTNESSHIPDAAMVTVTGGIVMGDLQERSVEQICRAWLKKQTTAQLVIEFDKAREQEIEIILKNAKVKVLK